MRIHEHQAKELLRRNGLAAMEGRVALTPDQAAEAFDALGGGRAVVKAQIHAGGRGKAGGIRPVGSAAEARQVAADLLGKPLVTAQTGPGGRVVRRLYIERACDVERELYLAVAIDRDEACPVMMACAEGGVEIEQLAARDPGKILRERIRPGFGMDPYQARRLAFALGLKGKLLSPAVAAMASLAKAFAALDCSLAEVNPLVVTKAGAILPLDAKMDLDDNALFRHPEYQELRDPNEENPAEAEAKENDLSYISLDGDIGCLVNGAGLAMATMDIIKLSGRSPANFLDVGGGASREKVTAAFKILLADPRVKAVLVNIFGGIMRCDVIAEGIVEAAREVKPKVPLVVRLEGTNADLGRSILEGSGLAIIPADSMSDAATKAVAAAG